MTRVNSLGVDTKDVQVFVMIPETITLKPSRQDLQASLKKEWKASVSAKL